MFRHWIDYIGDSQNQFGMLRQAADLRTGKKQVSRTVIDLEEIEAVQSYVNKVEVTDTTIKAFQKLIFELKKKDIKISDRRLVSCLHIMQASAALDSRTQTVPDDMEHLAFVLWERQEDIEDIQAHIVKMMNPFKDKVNTAYKEAVKIRDEVMSIADKTDRANKAIDARNVIDKITKRIDGVIKSAKSEGRSVAEFEAKRDEVASMVQEIVDKCLFNIDDMMSADVDELPF